MFARPRPIRSILTHDFTHRTHLAIFDLHYPRALPDWSSDDWITYLYQAFNLMVKLPDVVVSHTFVMGTRYTQTDLGRRLHNLNTELRNGAVILDNWLQKNKGVKMNYNLKTITCC